MNRLKRLRALVPLLCLFRCTSGRSSLRAAAGWLWLLSAPTMAGAEVARWFDVPAGEAVDTLKLAARQGGLEIIFFAETVRGVRTPALRGKFAPLGALARLLAGTGLAVVPAEKHGTLTIKRVAPPPSKRASGDPAESQSPEASSTGPPMKKSIPARLTGALAALTAALLPAQTVAPATAPKPAAANEETVLLNPFEVRDEPDKTYGALNSNSITRFNTELNKVPISADVFTEDFMRDVGAVTVEGLLSQYGAGMGVLSYAPDTDAVFQQPGDRGLSLGVRGLGAGTVKRDGFTGTMSTAVGTTSNFDVERAEVLRGPQGLLYGAGGPGGTINIVSKRAHFNRRAGNSSWRVDQYGSKQFQFDYTWGADKVAVRLSLLNEDQKYRRVMLNSITHGYYAQVAFKLPLRTTLRFGTQYSDSERTLPTNSQTIISFNNTNLDPRHNYRLSYLFHNRLTGAVNPASGAPFPSGAVADGGVTWDNLNSWEGKMRGELMKNHLYTIDAETVWTRWLSSQLTLRYNDQQSDNYQNATVGLSPPLLNGNPLNAWGNAMAAGMNAVEGDRSSSALRAAVLLTNDLFRKRAHSQTMLGYDVEWADQGSTNFQYYLADANFNVVYNPAVANNLGRTQSAQLWWPVGTSPIERPFYFRPTWDWPRLTVNGVNYVRMETNPRDPAWVRPNNPLGLAQLAGLPGVSGNNTTGRANKNRVTGFYLSNYTDWFQDRFGTLLGFRTSETFSRTPNTVAAVAAPYVERLARNRSFNLGVNYAVKDWLRAFYSFSSNYGAPTTNNDPLGETLQPSSGIGSEIGLKFNIRGNRLSGSVQYYRTDSKDEIFNIGSTIMTLINPIGLNGSREGTGGSRNQWVNLDRTTSGFEVILTASPTPNWRIRLAATSSDGQVLRDKVYPMVFNDNFYVKNGAVTFRDGTPFLVPTDAPTIAARVANLNAQVNPTTLQGQGTWAPLTIAMINDRNNPYWANPAEDNGRLQTSNLTRVLRFFVGPSGSALTGETGLPMSSLPYQWADPYGSKGLVLAARKGEYTVGYAQYRFNCTSMYTFSGEHLLKNVGLGGSVNTGMKNRTYYYGAPGGARLLYSAPETLQANLILSYRHKLGKRFLWTTQVNVENIFNNYSAATLPNNGAGYTNPALLVVTFYGQPRMYVWTNSIGF